MDTKNLLVQLNPKREHLRSLNELLNDSIQLKNGRLGFVNDSERKLSTALTQASQNPDEISQLGEKLDHNYRMYVKYEADILKYQQDIEVTKKEIKDLEQLLSTFPDKKAYCDFYKQKRDDFDKEDNQTSSRYSNVSSFPSMR
ncbi:hypothetical protein [Rickettsiella endosymbiont of Miltochrista miniata]|uniref:hypothetical protein n=1 Tax=Rickettsiella endosymbiont of Miltochrista miniata TaxID=3066239 RepID=UPI00313D9194